MTDGESTALCPRCGSAAAVHSISELAAMARNRLGQAQPGQAQPGNAAGPQPGNAAGPQPGYAAEPQSGPLPGYAAEPQAGPLPGYAGQPRSGPLPGSRSGGNMDFDAGDGLEQAVANVALGAAARFIGRAVSRRVQRTYSERVRPALAARQETMLSDQIAIAERHPDLRACLTDKVVFLAGGSRVLPMAGLAGMLTLQQADALVTQLKED